MRHNQMNPLKIQRDIKRVRAKMSNLARRSSAKSIEIMRDGAEAVMQQAMAFVPEQSGELGHPDHWEVDEQPSGLNRRLEYTVRLRPYARNRTRGKALSRYAAIMHDSRYTLGKGSIAKAERLGLSRFPIGSRKYVGRLYLSRAAANHRLNIEAQMRKEIERILR